jgi:putative hydrolase of the HAD superfamily
MTIENNGRAGVMKTYNHLFFDLDHTLWDFEANARATLSELHDSMKLYERGINDFDLFHKNYLAHNEKLWERYRKGFIKQDELRLKRMTLALLDFKIADEKLARDLSLKFLDLLPTRTLLFPNTIETLKYLADKDYHLHLITNGFEVTQRNKLKFSGLDVFFREIITSECSNSLKPQREIFEFALKRSGAEVKQSIMIGDSVEVDIDGARDAGMDQVFVNHLCIDCEANATFEVRSIKELELIF